MQERWCDQNFVEKWDGATLAGNPTRAEQLDILLSIVKKEYQAGKTILDLGIGSGQVEALIFADRSEANVVGVDSSPVMLELARKRLSDFADKYIIVQHDFEDLETLALPQRPYQIAISVQALQHVPHQTKQKLFKYVYSILEEHLDWLSEAGFHTACLHLHLDRALIAGIKGKGLRQK